MAKSPAAQRRDARARAAGFSSYSQQYRAQKRGLNAQQYRAGITARQNQTVAKLHTRLVGARRTRAGDVFAAVFLRQASAQWSSIRQRKGWATITVDLPDRVRAVKLGGDYGYRMDYLRDLVAEHGTWAAAVASLLETIYDMDSDELEGATVTVMVTK